MDSMFENCESLITFPDLSKWKFEYIRHMDRAFYGCKSLLSLPFLLDWKERNRYMPKIHEIFNQNLFEYGEDDLKSESSFNILSKDFESQYISDNFNISNHFEKDNLNSLKNQPKDRKTKDYTDFNIIFNENEKENDEFYENFYN